MFSLFLENTDFKKRKCFFFFFWGLVSEFYYFFFALWYAFEFFFLMIFFFFNFHGCFCWWGAKCNMWGPVEFKGCGVGPTKRYMLTWLLTVGKEVNGSHKCLYTWSLCAWPLLKASSQLSMLISMHLLKKKKENDFFLLFSFLKQNLLDFCKIHKCRITIFIDVKN